MGIFDWLQYLWPWYVAGSLIGLTVPLLLLLGNKAFGVSSNLRHVCAMLPGSSRTEFFNYNWREEAWNLVFVVGVVVGGFLVGFGARYAGGCTSGHAISGLSNLQLPSLVAVIGFFSGGLISTHMLLPLILGL